MERPRTKTIFVCQECGRESPRWLGRCPQCQQWNSLVETQASPPATRRDLSPLEPPRELAQIAAGVYPRLCLPLAEFDRVLGGGIVPGSSVLIGGDPGIGKSTLLLQVAALAAQVGGKVVYISGEESQHQVKLRADRLGITGHDIYLLAETDLEAILQHLEKLSPVLAIIDSIQTMQTEMEAPPGSPAQVRECTIRLVHWAKASNIPVLIAGHVTKDGAIAGPRLLEHMVDVVLYLEGEPFGSYRLLRGVKNRFGSTNEVGVFEMASQGLVEVNNPSLAFLSRRQPGAVGSVVLSTLEGTRPLLVEVQALTTVTSFNLPRRTANGVDFNRLLLVAAVLSKRLGLPLSNQDIILNVVGGLTINEPAADLGIALAIASSCRDAPVDPDLAVAGEVGLSGELRPVPQLERRLAEAARLGLKRFLVAAGSRPPAGPGIEVVEAASLRQALKVGLLSRKSNAQE
ncbi:MAG: DNA repair protein RadA [Chloroflexi bacterium]|nr:DNA repair protein RadA [Chloroflexota bacterium]